VAVLDVDPDDIHHEYGRRFADLTDAQIFEQAAAVISTPRRDATSSFVLHAPLELMARYLLLPLVSPPQRRAVRERMLWVASRYERAGSPIDEPAPATPPYNSVAEAQTALLGALHEGDVDGVDVAASQLLGDATLDDVMALAAPTLDWLAAAGHAPIGFFLLSRLATTTPAALALLRPTLRELARAPQLRMRWPADFDRPTGTEDAFIDALACTPHLGLPGTDFIFPIVHQVDQSGVARDRISGTIPDDIRAAARATLRIAACSMLQDDPQFAPYGWTHCLTLPHAIFEIGPWLPNRGRAAVIAGTYVVAFRAAEGAVVIDPVREPEPVTAPPLAALEEAPTVAAGAWYHASEDARGAALPELVGRAAAHEDAHLAKYTLACVAAAARDRARRSLYVAAAAALTAWWAQQPDRSFRDDL
jgi:hypothetical protein